MQLVFMEVKVGHFLLFFHKTHIVGQEERIEAIKSFREGKKDVLVATDIAAKGLDFPDVKHVINFDMPKEVKIKNPHLQI
jgi:ERCC4-related helicase